MINKGIPVSVALQPSLERESLPLQQNYNKKRLFYLSILAISLGIAISFIAKGLIMLIELITQISFFGRFSIIPGSPADHTLGYWVIFIPALGGLLIGLMALYGSKAIRGHGIPEAMEQILTNESKIKPSITYLKPLSSAISIGTGGPFGAEGPIIATGGALGSTLGQLLDITPNERKILLAAGATAGMSAIFGSPIAAILLAIELLLFEFSPRSFIPVAMACITGAAGHHIYFGKEFVFAMNNPIPPISNAALLGYSIIGIVVGLFSVITTKIVYGIEDIFEKLPIHWAWWPALGGIAVGVIGYFEPRTLGVGYNNITDMLNNSLPISFVFSLGLMKFISWSISLGSGTSGGTLAPLLTIGSAIGVLMGFLGQTWFPEISLSIPLAALVGMSAMFAGASRALLTSIVFALETTGQSYALLPLLASCTAAYMVSYFLMTNTIMTEKIARRGVYTPYTYEPDILEKIKVEEIADSQGLVMSEDVLISEMRDWLTQETDLQASYFIVCNPQGEYKGLLSYSSLLGTHQNPTQPIGTLIKRTHVFIHKSDTLKVAIEKMVKENVDILPVISEGKIEGILPHQQILVAYAQFNEHQKKPANLSIHDLQLKILVQGRKIISIFRKNKS